MCIGLTRTGPSQAVYSGPTPVHFRGVYSANAIRKGEMDVLSS